MNSVAVVLGAIVAGGVLGLLPSVADVRKAGPGDEVAHDLHSGLMIGAIALVALGALAMYETGSPKALIMAGAVAAAMVAAFEWLLRTDGLVIC